MELTGAPFVWLTFVIAGVAFGWAVWAVPKMVGNTPRLIARIVVMLMVNVLVMIAGLAKVNADMGFFTSWGDLFGAEPQKVSQQAGVDAAEAVKPLPSATAAPTATPTPEKPLPPLPSPGQRMQVYTYTGPESGLTARIEVVLPAGYETAAAKDRRYPVAQLFHGFPGTPSGWTSKMAVQARMDEAQAAGKVGDMIMVAPTITIPATVDSECVNGPAGTTQTETWVAKDVPTFIREHFRVIPTRDAWVAMGYSVGAYCATMMGIHHNDTFGAFVSLGGYVKPDFATGAPWPAGSPLADRYDLLAQIRQKVPAVAMYIQAGQQSPFWDDIEAFLAAVKAPASLTKVIVLDGGHRWDIWQGEMPKVAAWLGASLPAFKP